jgi:hypothetical protein
MLLYNVVFAKPVFFLCDSQKPSCIPKGLLCSSIVCYAKLETEGIKVGGEASLFLQQSCGGMEPSTVKNARTVSAFKKAYKKLRAEMVTPT